MGNVDDAISLTHAAVEAARRGDTEAATAMINLARMAMQPDPTTETDDGET